MKTSNFRVISLLMLLSTLFSLQVNAQVGIGTTNPDDSSMLDIDVSALTGTKKGVLIPRMTTTERNAIVSPASSLLVFDTTSNSYWFNNGDATTPVWKELVSGSSIVDANGDTKIEVEKTSNEDKIHFSTANAAGDASIERMNIDNTGKILMGTDLSAQATTFFEIGADGTIKLGNKGSSTLTGGNDLGPESDVTTAQNYTKITADGSLSYVGNATRWDDLKIPMNATNRGSSNQPEWLMWRNNNGSQGVWLWSFSDGIEEELYFVVQMPHGWKQGSDIYPHVHWTTQSGKAGNVTWALEYTWSNVGVPFTAPVIISSSTITKGNATVPYNHNLTSLPVISAFDKTLSSILVCRFFRKGNDGGDTMSGEVQVFEIDFHYQIDSDGSNQEFEKTLDTP
ncbi:hypothetical protein [Yeosuana marina]|uniref:hypothetical protein n=1 Tax=Yeosuana marina TaxID=1565536 RepID=UPI00141FBC5A|nr:hypothetical protein [Yeosuana marina]